MKKTTSLTTRRAFLAQAVLIPTAVTLAGCGSGGGGGSKKTGNTPATRSVAGKWTKTVLDAIAASTIGPPQNARAIAIIATAAFDAWAAYDDVAVGTRLGGTLRRPVNERTDANKSQAVAHAMYRAIVDLYPTQKATFDAQMTALGYDPANTSTDTTTPVGIGNTVAQALLDFRHNDGSNQLNSYADTTGYVVINTADNVANPKFWQQIRYPNGKSPAYIAPHWGVVTPFAMSSPSALRAPEPPDFGSAEYIRQMNEVIELTRNITTEQRNITEYWSDGPGTVQPPGHWLMFALAVSDRDGHDLDRDVALFFILGNAVFDASIGCWESKRFYNCSRPITAIHALSAANSDWVPPQPDNFQTPPFPEYTSGHSTFSAASAEVLKRFTRSDNFVYTTSQSSRAAAEPLVTRWTTFSGAAAQAGSSRRFGGIHFESADLEGRKMGRIIGGLVWDKAMTYLNGTVV